MSFFLATQDLWLYVKPTQFILISFQKLKNPPTRMGNRGKRTAAASWKWYRMMDDMLRPKHHINPPAQCDSPKDAVTVSPPPQAQDKRRVVRKRAGHRNQKHREPDWLVQLQEMERRDEQREMRPVDREEHERKALERAERESRLATELLERKYRDRGGFTESGLRDDKLMAISQSLQERITHAMLS